MERENIYVVSYTMYEKNSSGVFDMSKASIEVEKRYPSVESIKDDFINFLTKVFVKEGLTKKEFLVEARINLGEEYYDGDDFIVKFDGKKIIDTKEV